MQIKIVTLDVRLSSNTKRAIRWALLPVAVLAGSIAVASAYDTSWIAAGNKISAAALKGDLDAIQTQLGVVHHTSSAYSLNAVYCGTTSTAYDGAGVGLYTGGASKCRAACNSTTAHQCTAEEVIRSVVTGASPPNSRGWYSTGEPGPAGDDCGAWSSTTGHNGVTWIGYPQSFDCTIPVPIMCCD
jgi:hypothetical protein